MAHSELTNLQYSTGTAFQTTTTVTGVGTTWTSAMIGSPLVYSNGVYGGIITAVASTTSLTVSISQTVSSTPGIAYNILYPGLQIPTNGNVGIGSTITAPSPLTIGNNPNFRISIATAGVPSVTPSNTGGNIATGTYYYVITANTAIAGTAQSSESLGAAIVGTTGSVLVSWTAIPGASRYSLYRTTTSGTYSGTSFIATVTGTSFTDTLLTAASGSPPTTDTTTTYANSEHTSATLTSTSTNLFAKVTDVSFNVGANSTAVSEASRTQMIVPANYTYNLGSLIGEVTHIAHGGSGTVTSLTPIVGRVLYCGTNATLPTTTAISGISQVLGASVTGTGGTVTGIIGQSSNSSNGVVTSMYGVRGISSNNLALLGSTGAVTNMSGIIGQSSNSSNGVVTSMYGVRGISSNNLALLGSTGAVTNMYGGHFASSESTTNAATLQTGVFASTNRTGIGTTTNQYGLYTTNDNAGTVTNQAAVKATASHNTTTTMAQQIGADLYASNSSTGTITNQSGVNIVMDNNGTITNRYGLKILNTNAGTLTNPAYDIHAGTSTAYNYFAGKVGIQNTAPVVPLEVGSSLVSDNTVVTPGRAQISYADPGAGPTAVSSAAYVISKPSFSVDSNSAYAVIGEMDVPAGNTHTGYLGAVYGVGTNNGTGSIALSSVTGYSSNNAGNMSSMSGGDFYADNYATGIIDSAVGVSGRATNNGTGTHTESMGGYFYSQNGSASTITDNYGTRTYAENATTGVITNNYGLKVETHNVSTGTITNNYGVHISSALSGTITNQTYDLYAGTAAARNYFAGSVGIGTTSPTSKLTINPSLLSTSTFSAWTIGPQLTSDSPTLTASGNYGSNIQLLQPAPTSNSSTQYYTNVVGADVPNTATVTYNTLGGYDGIINYQGQGAISNIYGMRLISENNSTVATAATTIASFVIARLINNGTSTNVIGTRSQATNNGGSVTGTATNLFGTQSQAWVSGTNTSTNMYGAYSSVSNYASTTVTNAYASYADFGLLGGVGDSTGTITNGYGMYINNINATNKWSLYAADATAPSYFAGSVGIGTTAPSNKLTVNRNTVATPTPPSNIDMYVVGADTTATGIGVDSFGGTASLIFRQANGTSASKTAITSGGNVGIISFQGYGATTYIGTRARIGAVATETWTDTANGLGIRFFTTANTTATINEVVRIDHTGYLGIGTTAPASKLEVAGPIATAIQTITASTYTLTATDSTILADTTSNAITLTLPTAVGISGRVYTIKRKSGGANGLTINTTSSQLIDGALTAVISTQWTSINVQSDNTAWYII